MMRSNLLPISQAGFKTIGCALGLFVLSVVFDFDFFSFIFLVLIAILIFIYRNPEREMIVFQNHSVLSPVDGKVLSIENIEDSEYAYKVTVDSTYADVGVLRVPMNSSVKEIAIVKGSKLAHNSTVAAKINENCTLVFEDSSLNRVKVTHLLKQSFADICITSTKSQDLLQTTRYGFMTNGITTIYLPQNFRVNVSVGNDIMGSETLIGYFS